MSAAKASITKSSGVSSAVDGVGSVTKQQQQKTASILKSPAFCKFLDIPEPESSRSNVVKKMWEYIKRNKLQVYFTLLVLASRVLFLKCYNLIGYIALLQSYLLSIIVIIIVIHIKIYNSQAYCQD
ncbi:hypothetical protein AQUCO_00600477v1 [Aquilegia coerulea]|uniref:DM2 domain-containing protein n=1 Tax=Aquilegia coerulea TaxID=218851 RepID=A0A2G5EPT3_AQUCA|nr:hypothetical protein AQUCO_00600477v1 [Aquilegia coerulea]